MRFFEKNIWILAFLFILAILITIGCVKEEFSSNKIDTSLELEPSLATPLGYFDFRLNENLKTSENATISTNSDRIVTLNYFGEISSEPAGDLFKFNNISDELLLSDPSGVNIDLSSAGYERKFSATLPLALLNTADHAKIDSLIISSGHISISEIKFHDANGEVLIVFPGLKHDDDFFQIRLLPDNDNILSEVSDYTLELSSDEERNNLIDVDIYVFYPQQNNTLFASTPLISFSFDFQIQEWKSIYGFLGKENIQLGWLNLSTILDSNFAGGKYYSIDPKIYIKTINTFHMPLAMGLSEVYAITREAGNMGINGPGVPLSPDYFFPAYPEPENLLQGVDDSLIINVENSNLREVILSNTEGIRCHLELLTNPRQENIQNIINAESRFSAYAELQLPFVGNAILLSFLDTIAIDFSKLNFPVDNIIEKVIFQFYYENSFPAEIDFQLYFANENLIVTDTVFDSFVKIKSAEPLDEPVNDPAFVSGQIEALLAGNKLENVRETRYLIAEAMINTNKSREIVKIFDNQNLYMNLGIIFDIKTKIEDL